MSRSDLKILRSRRPVLLSPLTDGEQPILIAQDRLFVDRLTDLCFCVPDADRCCIAWGTV